MQVQVERRGLPAVAEPAAGRCYVPGVGDGGADVVPEGVPPEATLARAVVLPLDAELVADVREVLGQRPWGPADDAADPAVLPQQGERLRVQRHNPHGVRLSAL